MRIKVLVAAMAITLSACSSIPQSDELNTYPVVSKESIQAAEELNQVVEQYFDQSLALNPVYATFVGESRYNDKFSDPINQESTARQLSFEEYFLKRIERIDPSLLEGQDLLSYQVFKLAREEAIKGFEFENHLMPISQIGGAHTVFSTLGAGGNAQPFETVQDFEDFEKRSIGFAVYMESAVDAMKEGMQKNIVLPRVLAVKVLPQLQAHLVDDVEQSLFWGPIRALDENKTLTQSEKDAITAKHKETITKVIIPAYKATYEFMLNEYLPNTRETFGISELPNGKAWYEYEISTNTTLPLTAQEIHRFGLKEVARILEEMNKVREQVNFSGDLPAFFEHLKESDEFYFDSADELIAGYTDIKKDINARVGQLFNVFPKADYEVRAVESYLAASAAGASYQPPAPDGSRPGIFYINTHNLKAQPKFLMETLSIHEAAPGHHFQIAIQQEVESLPKFRKFGGYTVFAEGWALYAESLGKEMGLFTDPYMWYGRLVDEQLRAMRLVVDTGLHAMGWSREKAIEYIIANSSMAESDVVSEVERYISWPGQALAYKTGERKIRELRNLASRKLGDKFDIKEFHTQILIDGALPMPVLEQKIKRWIKEEQKS
ncbi:DUF885 domain-containing protein [Alteromonadaceae bacterium M269]|nr:DUF885 domain-containing protein [Alteromonadaceae bacterium M269]